MGQVISFEDYVPSARYDDVAWTAAEIYEATAFGGPWSLIDTIALAPVDDDPSRPQSRSFTTSEATDTAGLWYRAVFIDGAGGSSLPTDPVQNAPEFDATTLYLTPEELKASLDLTSTTVGEEDIKRAIPAACRAIDAITGRFFYLTGDETNGETRLYTRMWNPRRLDVDDVVALASVDVDENGDGSYERSLEVGTDYVLAPANAHLKGRPFEQLVLRGRHRNWPEGPDAIRLTGRFGWEEVPPGVVEASSILAARLVKVIREASFGVYVIPNLDTATAVRLGRQDPHVMMALTDVMKVPTVA